MSSFKVTPERVGSFILDHEGSINASAISTAIDWVEICGGDSSKTKTLSNNLKVLKKVGYVHRGGVSLLRLIDGKEKNLFDFLSIFADVTKAAETLQKPNKHEWGLPLSDTACHLLSAISSGCGLIVVGHKTWNWKARKLTTGQMIQNFGIIVFKTTGLFVAIFKLNGSKWGEDLHAAVFVTKHSFKVIQLSASAAIGTVMTGSNFIAHCYESKGKRLGSGKG